MRALHEVTGWPVEHVAAAVVHADGVETIGDPAHQYRLASLTKPVTAWAIMIGVEEGIVSLDEPLRHVAAPDGATMRHLLSHAAGFAFDGATPIAPIERRRIYSNTGIERAADELAGAAGMPFDQYLAEAVLEPLGMQAARLRGSPAHGLHAPLDAVVRFVDEMRRPRLLAPESHAEIISVQYPTLAGIVPDVGRFDPCPWGLGVEVRGDKSPHWTGATNSPATFGHFGGSGTMMWVDPAIDTGLIALTDRRFDDWSSDALILWRHLSDAVVAERAAAG